MAGTLTGKLTNRTPRSSCEQTDLPHRNAEAAQRLGISITTLNRWAKNGAIPVAVQAPGRTGTRLYDEAVIDAHADTTTAA